MSNEIHKYDNYDIYVCDNWKYNILFQKSDNLSIDKASVIIGDLTFTEGQFYNQIGYPAAGY